MSEKRYIYIPSKEDTNVHQAHLYPEDENYLRYARGGGRYQSSYNVMVTEVEFFVLNRGFGKTFRLVLQTKDNRTKDKKK